MVFDGISKAVRGQAQRCNVCGQVSQMKDTNVCKQCWPKEKHSHTWSPEKRAEDGKIYTTCSTCESVRYPYLLSAFFSLAGEE